MGQYKLWINKYYRLLIKHMRLTTITQLWINNYYGMSYKAYAPHNNNTTMDQQLLWDDLQIICVQQKYTNMVKRRIDMGS